jgi:hypothetical protein
MLTSAQKPDIGPTGKPTESKPNPPIIERFWSPPGELYDLEATAGVIFEGINTADWPQAQAGLSTLQTTWQQVKPLIGAKKGVKEADAALDKLVTSVDEKKIANSYEALNKFMGSISDIGKSYKLSPLSDIIAIGNSLRNVNFYVADNDWKKAITKAKELEGTWGQAKPSLEKIGILGEVTAAHTTMNQIKDAVNAENAGSFQDHIADINESMGRIRNFYRGK